jgi:hypothetical protein
MRAFGDRAQSTSEDCEAQLNAIVPWKPLIAVTDMGVAADWPCNTNKGEAEKLKSSGPSTVWEIAGDVLPRRFESPL